MRIGAIGARRLYGGMRSAAIGAMMTLGALAGATAAEAQSVTISPRSATADERSSLTFEIDSSWRYDVLVQFGTRDRTATESEDFIGYTGTGWYICLAGDEHIGPDADECELGGQYNNSIEVTHLDDRIEENDEQYQVWAKIIRYETGELNDGGYPVVLDCPGCSEVTATGTIRDPEPEEIPEGTHTVRMATGSTSVTEGGSATLNVEFIPEGASHTAASVEWETEESEYARAGRDYTAASGTVRFSACSSGCGRQTRTITVRTRQDDVSEETERFSVNLKNPSNAEIDPAGWWTLVEIEDDDENSPPAVTVSASKTTVNGGERIKLNGRATDQNGSVTGYQWSGLGTFSRPNRQDTDWRAPRPQEDTAYDLRLTATDNEGATGSATIRIQVNRYVSPDNRPPTVSIRADRTRVGAGETVELEATATDPNGDTLTYAWAGSGSFSSTTTRAVTWTAPQPADDTDYTLSVTVNDGNGGETSASRTITVAGAPNLAPTVTLTASDTSVEGGDEVTLTATASDSDGTVAATAYSWSGEGTFTGTGNSVRWTAPSPDRTTRYSLEVTATDDDGATGVATVAITVAGSVVETTNTDPTVSLAASATSVAAGGSVTLTATASDEDGDTLTYAWSGSGTFTTGETANQATWTAPEPRRDTSYHLSVAVTDGQGGHASDAVPITVSASEATTPPPTVVASGTPETVDGGGEVLLTAIATIGHDSSLLVYYEWDGDGTFTEVSVEKDETNARWKVRTTWTAPTPVEDTIYTQRVTFRELPGLEEASAIVNTAVNALNSAPTATLSADKTSVAGGGTVELTATGTDANGDDLTYAWSGPGSFSPADGATTTWTAPTPGSEATYTLTVTVADPTGDTGSASVDITVAGPDNTAPTVTLSADETSVEIGDDVTLTATATDADGTIESYAWSGEGTFTGSGATVTWTAPSSRNDKVYALQVTVTDDDGATAGAATAISVAGANQLPTVTVAASATKVASGGQITLTATAADPDGSIRAYWWTGEGRFEAHEHEATWFAPEPETATSYTLTVTTEDNERARASASVEVRVGARPRGPENEAPTVTLRASRTSVTGGREVTLTATATDDGGVENLSFRWDVVSCVDDEDGTSLNPSWYPGTFHSANANGSRIIWTAERNSHPVTCDVEVRVSDTGEKTASASVAISIGATKELNTPPTVTLTAARTRIQPRSTVRLTARTSDAEGRVVSYEWIDDRTGSFSEERTTTPTTFWTAPNPALGGEYTLVVTVRDNEGASASGSVAVFVEGRGDNSAPGVELQASAEEIDAGGVIGLFANATDDDGTVESYEWSVTDDAGELRIERPGEATWTAPRPEVRTEYTLSVTATDDDGESSTDSIVITVNATDAPAGQPRITVFPPPEIPEGETGRIRLFLDKVAPANASIRYTIGTSSERLGSDDGCRDYVHVNYRKLNLAGKHTADIPIQVLKDTCINEGREGITVELADSVGVEPVYERLPTVLIAERHSTVRIMTAGLDTDEDGDYIIREGSGVTLTVERDVSHPGYQVPATVGIRVKGQRGASGDDYEPLDQTLSFGARESTKRVTIRARNDNAFGEINEALSVELYGAHQTRITGKSVWLDIEDTDGQRSIVVSMRTLTPVIDEGDTARCELSVREVYGNRLDADLRVKWWTPGDTAQIDRVAEWITFTRAASQVKTLTIPTRADRRDREQNFSCEIGDTLSNEDDYDYDGAFPIRIERLERNVKVLNVNVSADNDAAVWAHDQVVMEGRSLTFEMRLDGELTDHVGEDESLNVAWRTSEADTPDALGGGADFADTTGSHTFTPGGADSFRITIRTTCDNVTEGNEYYWIKAVSKNATRDQVVGVEAVVKVTILSVANRCGGATGVIGIGDTTATEGQPAIFTVTLDPPYSERPVFIDYETENVSARHGTDYTRVSGTARIAANSGSTTIEVRTLTDDVRDDSETFHVELSNARDGQRHYGFRDPRGVGTIIEETAVRASFHRVPRTHNGNAFAIEIRLTGALPVTTDQFAAAVVVGGGSVAGTTQLSGTRWELSIQPGGKGSMHVEMDHVALSAHGREVLPVDPVGIEGSAVATLVPSERETVNEDGEIVVNESTRTVMLTVRLDFPLVRNRAGVTAYTEAGTATPGQDYEGIEAGHRVSFERGEQEKDFRVRIFQTTETEEAETFTVRISEPFGKLVIADDAAAVTVRIIDNSLGAQFLNAPTVNDGSNFTVDLRFHPPVELDAAGLADLASKIETNGDHEIASVTQKTAGDNANYVVTVDPDERKHVRLALPYGTRVGDRVMQYDLEYWIAGPVSGSINDAEATEGTDTHARFTVTLTQGPHEGQTVSVDYATADGSATAGSDYTATSGTLTFGAGQTTNTIEVPITDDEVDDDGETFTITLTNPVGVTLTDAEGTGTIKNRDMLPIALLARFGRTTASQVVDQVEERIDSPRTPGFDGANQLAQIVERQNDPGQRSRMHDDPWDIARFGLTEEAAGGTLSFWSSNRRDRFDGRQGGVSMGGEVRTTLFGADYARGRFITGVSVARSIGTGDYRGKSTGEVTSTMTGLYPWIGYRAGERMTLWAVAGRGGGRMLLATPAADEIGSAVTMRMAAGGMRGALFSSSALSLDIKTDAMWVGTSMEGRRTTTGRLSAARAAVTRLRSGIEASRSYSVSTFSVKPMGEVALRHDGGDAETGAGMDVGIGLEVADGWTGISVDLRLRRLLVHQAEGFREQGFSVSLGWDPSPESPLGFSARMAPSWGGQASIGDGLWRGRTLTRMPGQYPGGRGGQFAGEFAYGLPLSGRFVGTPRMGFSSSDFRREYRVGYGLGIIDNGKLKLDIAVDVLKGHSTYREGANHGARAQGRISWD